MAINFTATNQQNVSWSEISLPSLRSYLTWIYINTLPSGSNFHAYFYQTNSSFLAAGERIDYSSSIWRFFNSRSPSSGVWQYGSALPTGLVNLAITYDSSSASNDPVFYLNGSLVTNTETSTPSGGQAAITTFVIGDALSGSTTTSPNGNVLSHLLYERILSAAEIADAYASRLAIPSYRGLVFAPRLNGASGGVVDGATLSSSNKIVDVVSGALGTPSGSPVLVADNYLTME